MVVSWKCPYEYNELQVVQPTGTGPFDLNNVGKMNALFMAPGKMMRFTRYLRQRMAGNGISIL